MNASETDYKKRIEDILLAYDNPMNNGAGHHNVVYSRKAILELLHQVEAESRIDEHEWVRNYSEQFGNAGTGDVHEYRLKADVSDERMAGLHREESETPFIAIGNDEPIPEHLPEEVKKIIRKSREES